MTSGEPKVRFFLETSFLLDQRIKLRSFIEQVFAAEGKPLSSLTYIFTTDKSLLSLNKQFLGHDYYTDVLTFDLSETEGIAGEIYISIDRVRENASAQRVAFKNELVRVMVHGALHLCGYGDKTGAEKIQMKEKEDAYLKDFT